MSDEKTKFVIFKTFRSQIPVSRSSLMHHSKRFKDALAKEKHKVSTHTLLFDLRQYDLTAVQVLVDFLADKNINDITLTHYAIADLLQLARILEMDKLNAKLEKFLKLTNYSSVDHIVNALLSIGLHPSVWVSPLGRSLFEVSKANFKQLPKASGYYKLPVHILIEILDSCDLATYCEIDVYDLASKWLKHNNSRLVYASSLFECIRFYRVNDQQRAYLFAATRQLPQGVELEAILKTVIGTHFNFAACALKSHAQNPRCGVPFKDHRESLQYNIIPNFFELSLLKQNTCLNSTGLNCQINGLITNENPHTIVTKKVTQPRSFRKDRRDARQKRDELDKKSKFDHIETCNICIDVPTSNVDTAKSPIP